MLATAPAAFCRQAGTCLCPLSRPASRARPLTDRQTRHALRQSEKACRHQACGRSLKTAALGESDAPVTAESRSSVASFQGEDAAKFDVQQQSTAKWVFFTVELAVVLAILYMVRLQTLFACAPMPWLCQVVCFYLVSAQKPGATNICSAEQCGAAVGMSLQLVTRAC